MKESASSRGVALIAVLWVLLLAGLLLLAVRAQGNLSLTLAHAELEAVQARWLARAGVDQAMAVLEEDGRASDSPLDYWYSDAASFEDVPLATGTFRVTAPSEEHADAQGGSVSGAGEASRFGLTDLAGRLNVNHASEEQLLKLAESPGLLELDEATVASILDWRDEGEQVRAGGAGAGHYGILDFPYEIANRPLRTLHELRLIKGVSLELFRGDDRNLNGLQDAHEEAEATFSRGLSGLVTVHGYERNRTGAGGTRTNLNRADEAALQSQLQFSEALARATVQKRNENEFRSVFELTEVQPEDGNSQGDADDDTVHRVDLDWLEENLDLLTLSEDERIDPRININTAPEAVLLTLPEMTEDVAAKIVRHRTSNAGPFATVGDLRRSGTTDDRLFRAIAEHVTVRSQVFQIDATGRTPRGVQRRIVTVVDRGVIPMRILYWHEGE